MKNYDWIWQKMPPRLGVTGETFRATLNAQGLSAAALFARECIQNSADAAALARKEKIAPADSKLKLEFEFRKLSGIEKKDFLNTLRAPSLAKRINELDISDDCYLKKANDLDPITLLIVRDYNTTGLYGNPFGAGMQSHLARLLFSLGDRTKNTDLRSSGGSYGFGKGALSRASKAYQVIAYSRFDETPDNNVHSRLLGCGYYPHHSFDKNYYSGIADFGVCKPDDNEELYAALENGDAENIARKLHIGARDKGETGTSILIPDPDIKPEELAREIETWWFPAMISHLYEISIKTEDGKIPLRPGSRANRPDLYPFIKSYRLAVGIDEPSGSSEKKFNFEQIHNRKTGVLGVVLSDEQPPPSADAEAPKTEVALIRSNRMVIQFLHVTDAQPTAKGAFVAHDDVDHILKLSEPPSHLDWDSNASDVKKTYGTEGTDIVGGIKLRIKTNTNNFRRNAAPKKRPTDNHLKLFDNVLSRLFASKAWGPPPPPSGQKSNFSLQFIDGPTLRDSGSKNQIYFESTIKIELMPGVIEQKKFTFNPKCQISEDEGAGTDLDLNIQVLEGELIKDANHQYSGALSPKKRLLISVESSKYSSDWTVNFTPTITEVE